MIGRLNLRTKTQTRDRGSIVHNHCGKSFLSISSFQYHNYQNAQTFLDVLVALWKTAPLYIHIIQLQLNVEFTCYNDDIMLSCGKHVEPGMESAR